MIKNKYKTLEIVKQKHDKIIERVISTNPQDTKYYIVKSYPIEDAKSIEN